MAQLLKVAELTTASRSFEKAKTFATGIEHYHGNAESILYAVKGPFCWLYLVWFCKLGE